MPRYIDAEKCQEVIDKELGVYDTSELKEMLSYFPTADVQEVKHGKWIQFKEMRRDDGEIYDYCCSRCCGLAGKDDYDNHAILSAYCPHCGTKMDGE